MIDRAADLVMVRRRARIDRHAADRVAILRWGGDLLVIVIVNVSFMPDVRMLDSLFH